MPAPHKKRKAAYRVPVRLQNGCAESRTALTLFHACLTREANGTSMSSRNKPHSSSPLGEHGHVKGADFVRARHSAEESAIATDLYCSVISTCNLPHRIQLPAERRLTPTHVTARPDVIARRWLVGRSQPLNFAGALNFSNELVRLRPESRPLLSPAIRQSAIPHLDCRSPSCCRIRSTADCIVQEHDSRQSRRFFSIARVL